MYYTSTHRAYILDFINCGIISIVAGFKIYLYTLHFKFIDFIDTTAYYCSTAKSSIFFVVYYSYIFDLLSDYQLYWVNSSDKSHD